MTLPSYQAPFYRNERSRSSSLERVSSPFGQPGHSQATGLARPSVNKTVSAAAIKLHRLGPFYSDEKAGMRGRQHDTDVRPSRHAVGFGAHLTAKRQASKDTTSEIRVVSTDTRVGALRTREV